MEKITSKDNKYVKMFIKLAKSKSYRNEMQLFVLEGKKLVSEAYNNGIEIEMVFVSQECRQNSNELETLFQEVKCYEINDIVFDKIKQSANSNGIFAIAKQRQQNLELEDISAKGRYVMLVDLQDIGNVGTIIRTADAMGFDGVILSQNTCDLYSIKVMRSSMGSLFRMKTLTVESSVEEFLSSLVENDVQVYASVIDSDAQEITKVEYKDPMVLMIGNEGNGLTQQVVDIAQHKITIRMNGNAQSLNASMASAIMLYEIMRNKE